MRYHLTLLITFLMKYTIYLIIISSMILAGCQEQDIAVSEKSSWSLVSPSIHSETSNANDVPNISSSASTLSWIEWIEVSHKNFWNNPKVFSGADYLFPNIAFSYPSNWKLECCWDTDGWSFHVLLPGSEKLWINNWTWDYLHPPADFPSITLYSVDWDKILMWWSVDKPVYMTPDEYLESYGVGNDIKTPIKWWRIKVVHWSYPEFNEYLVKVDNGVVTFRFNNPKLFEKWWEEKFMSLLRKSKS